MTISSPKVSVIVLNWNGKRFLQRCLTSLFNQDYSNFEILLVDNGSSDASVEFVNNNFGFDSRLKVVVLPKNYGFSKGNNIGVKHADGDYIIFLNNDTEVSNFFITELVAAMKQNYDIGCVGCGIISLDGTFWFSQKFLNGGFIVPFFLQNLVEKRINELSNSFNYNLANSGCAVLFRKDVLDLVGFFDEDYWSNFEDWDLGYRVNLAGFKSLFIPKNLVLHVGAGSEGFSPVRRTKIYQNMLRTYFKNYETRNLISRFPIIMFLLIPMWHFAWFLHGSLRNRCDFEKRNSLSFFLSLPKSYLHFLQKLRLFMIKRYHVQSIRKVSDRQLFSNLRKKNIF